MKGNTAGIARPGPAPRRGGGGRGYASLGLAILVYAALAALTALIFRGALELVRLESRNEAEQLMNALLGGLRDHADFGQAVEASDVLKEKVVGIGIYGTSGALLYSWGSVPPAFSPPELPAEKGEGPERLYIEKGRNDSLVVLFRTSRIWPRPPPPPHGENGRERPAVIPEQRSEFFEAFRAGDLVFLELKQSSFFHTERFLSILFPAILLALALLVYAARRLLLRNAEYRERIEEQKNLVVLGTAASTLAHEIKNPLLAIRLQTSLLARTLPGGGGPELSIIEAEVERLSLLSHRVGDYLRDPRGAPRRIEVAEIAAEVGRRLLGREALHPPAAWTGEVLIDPERLRSILENLVRNALESGGPEEEVAIELSRDERFLRIEIVDRGSGIRLEDRERIFDPFFTTKSRGSGIGLPISRRFAEAAGGTISLEPRSGGGTRAVLVLPPSSPVEERKKEDEKKGGPS